MVIDFTHEAAKRRERPEGAKSAGAGPIRSGDVHALRRSAGLSTRPAFTVADCGSGWYHDLEIARAASITSHHD